MPQEKFKVIAKTCPWRKDDNSTKFKYCSSLYKSPNQCKEVNCAIWHFLLQNITKD